MIVLVDFIVLFFFSSRRRHTRSYGDWSSDVCSSDLPVLPPGPVPRGYSGRVSDPTREGRARACAYGWSVSDVALEGLSSPADAVSATASAPPCPSAAQPHYTNSIAHTAPRTIAAGSRPDEPPATRGSPAGGSLLLVGLAPAKRRSPGKYAGREIRSPAKSRSKEEPWRVVYARYHWGRGVPSQPWISRFSSSGRKQRLAPSPVGQPKVLFSKRLVHTHSPEPSHTNSRSRVRLRFVNTKKWPERGSCCSTVCTRAYSPLKFWRISTGSRATKMRVAVDGLSMTGAPSSATTRSMTAWRPHRAAPPPRRVIGLQPPTGRWLLPKAKEVLESRSFPCRVNSRGPPSGSSSARFPALGHAARRTVVGVTHWSDTGQSTPRVRFGCSSDVSRCKWFPCR